MIRTLILLCLASCVVLLNSCSKQIELTGANAPPARACSINFIGATIIGGCWDQSCDKADPFIVVRRGKSTLFRSATVKSTDDPVWDQKTKLIPLGANGESLHISLRDDDGRDSQEIAAFALDWSEGGVAPGLSIMGSQFTDRSARISIEIICGKYPADSG